MSVPPDPTDPDILEGLRAYLNSLGLAREPAVAGTEPPMWIAPALGTPAPGEGENPTEVGPTIVVGIRKGTGVPPARYENFLRTDSIQFVVRSAEAWQAYEWEAQVRAALNDKRGWQMANVPVNESLLFKDLQPVGSDNTGYLFTMEYLFNLWTPYA